MAKFDDYIFALTAPAKSALGLEDGVNLKTRKLTTAARWVDIGSKLTSLAWGPGANFYCSNIGFAGTVLDRKTGKSYFVLLNRDSPTVDSKIISRGKILGLTKPTYDDVFFIFCVHALALPLKENADIPTLQQSLTVEGVHGEIDFDVVRRSYGEFYTWEFEVIPEIECNFVDLLVSGTIDISSVVNFNSKIIFPSQLAAEVAVNVIDLQAVLGSLIARVAVVAETPIRKATISSGNFKAIFETFRKVKIAKKEIIFKVSGGICFEFSLNGEQRIGLSLRDFSDAEIYEIEGHLRTLAILSKEVEEGHIVAIIYYLNEFVDLDTKYLSSPQALKNDLDLTEDLSIDMSSLTSVYERFFILDASESLLDGQWALLAALAVQFKRFRSPFITPNILKIASLLTKLSAVDSENIYLSLTATHWKHCFLEVFRLIEGLYYFGLMNKLKKSLASPLSEYDLSIQCRSDIGWKVGDMASIQALFELVPLSELVDCNPMEIVSIQQDLKAAKTDVDVMRMYGKKIYSIRNSEVHQGEHETDKKVEVTAECWPKLTEGLYRIVNFFYTEHPEGMPTG